jgi:cellulose/xylan binding protein with CBM9 domain
MTVGGGVDTVDATMLATVPTVDGDCWTAVPSLRLCDVRTGAAPVWPTDVRVAYTETALWLLYTCAAQTVRATMTRYKERVWLEDAVEAYVVAPADPHLYEFQLNPIGTGRDLRVIDPGTPHQRFDDGWSCAGWVTGTAIDRGADRNVRGWRAMMGLPWRSLSPHAPRSPGWRIGLFRIERDPEEFSGARWLPQHEMELHAPPFLAALTVAG